MRCPVRRAFRAVSAGTGTPESESSSRPLRRRPVASVLALLVLVVVSHILASPASASTGHLESGSPGPDSVTAFGSATAVPGATLHDLAAPVVGTAATPSGLGYWVVAADGGVFAFGDAPFEGSTGNIHLNAPVVGMAATPDRARLLAGGRRRRRLFLRGRTVRGIDRRYPPQCTGGGDGCHPHRARLLAGGRRRWRLFLRGRCLPGVDRRHPPQCTGGGDGCHRYRRRLLAGAADGGVFAFGAARFEGSMGGSTINAPVVAMAAPPDGRGYWLVASDGGIFAFGGAPFEGSDGGTPKQAPAVGIAGRPGGYWIAYGVDPGSAMIPAIAAYAAGRADNVTVAVEDLTTGQIYQFRPGVVENTASTLKVDILATLLVQAQAAVRQLTPEEQSLAVPMIEESLDSAADTLWTRLGPGAVGAFERQAGMASTVPATDGVWGTTTTTALDRLAMVRTLVQPNPLLTDASRSYVLGLMENITPSQDWGLPVVYLRESPWRSRTDSRSSTGGRSTPKAGSAAPVVTT